MPIKKIVWIIILVVVMIVLRTFIESSEKNYSDFKGLVAKMQQRDGEEYRQGIIRGAVSRFEMTLQENVEIVLSKNEREKYTQIITQKLDGSDLSSSLILILQIAAEELKMSESDFIKAEKKNKIDLSKIEVFQNPAYFAKRIRKSLPDLAQKITSSEVEFLMWYETQHPEYKGMFSKKVPMTFDDHLHTMSCLLRISFVKSNTELVMNGLRRDEDATHFQSIDSKQLYLDVFATWKSEIRTEDIDSVLQRVMQVSNLSESELEDAFIYDLVDEDHIAITLLTEELALYCDRYITSDSVLEKIDALIRKYGFKTEFISESQL